MLGLEKFGGIGLHRIQHFFDSQEIDVERLSQRSLVVTGTNGKGSTSHLTAATLASHGLRVGVFTSPHMFDVRERFLLGGDQIDLEVFERLSKAILAFNDTLPAGDKLGAFQFLFLVAIAWFEESAPDAIVWEAGIGGRYDPTRMVRAKVGAVTSVELEHTDVLGGTEELIAYDKVDAVAPGGTVLLSPLVPVELRDRLATYCALSGRRLTWVDDIRQMDGIAHSASGSRFRVSVGTEAARDIQLALIGDHQANNAMTADALAAQWLANGDIKYSAERAWRALGEVSVPGRLERIARDPDVWIDVGHTPHAVGGVISSIQSFLPARDVIVVFGVSSSKEVEAIARRVAAAFDDFILTRALRSGADPQQFLQHFEHDESHSLTVEPDIVIAAKLARERARDSRKTILVVGGLFLATEFQVAWNGGDPRSLDFL